MEQETETLVKGGTCWFTMSINRGKDGLVVYVKTDPRIEALFAGMSGGSKEPVEAYGAQWYPIGEKKLEIHALLSDLQPSSTYVTSSPGEALTIPLKGSGTERVNISFLRLVGIGSPEGVTFGIVGPFSREYIRDVQAKILKQVRNLIQDYVLPININLRISSQEV